MQRVVYWLAGVGAPCRESDDRGTRSFTLRFGFTAALLLNLKQVNLVLLILLMASFMLVTLRDRRLWSGKFFGLLPAMLGPGLIVHLAWHIYVEANLHEGKFGILPLQEWHFSLLPKIVAAIGQDSVNIRSSTRQCSPYR